MKCDEAKPACQKCITTGRVCDGYPNPRALQIRHYDPQVALRDPASLPRNEQSDIVSLSNYSLDMSIFDTISRALIFIPLFPTLQVLKRREDVWTFIVIKLLWRCLVSSTHPSGEIWFHELQIPNQLCSTLCWHWHPYMKTL